MFDKYVSLAQPAVHLRTAASSAFTRLGGTPSLPPEFDWPEADGQALPFLLQVDLAEVYGVLPSFLPASGCLFFFFDDRRYRGGHVHDKRWWRVLFHAGDPTQFVQRPRSAAFDERQVYLPRSLEAVRIESLPSHYRFPNEFSDHTELHSYTEFSLRPFGDSLAHHQMLGHPSSLQDGYPEFECELRTRGIDQYCDPREATVAPILEASRDWRLLCQVDTDEEAGWMWGDVGTIFFWIREPDAKRLDFEKVWLTFECL
jgi:uncharacterized protein YwqG